MDNNTRTKIIKVTRVVMAIQLAGMIYLQEPTFAAIFALALCISLMYDI